MRKKNLFCVLILLFCFANSTSCISPNNRLKEALAENLNESNPQEPSSAPTPRFLNEFLDRTIEVGDNFTLTLELDKEGYVLSCDCPEWLSLDGSKLEGTPLEPKETVEISVTATYGENKSVVGKFTLTVNEKIAVPRPAPNVTPEYCDPIQLIVDTDLGVGDGFDPDDIQSLVSFLHQTDCLKPKAIVSTTSRSIPSGGLPGNQNKIKEWVRRVDLDYVKLNVNEFVLSQDKALNLVVQGSTTQGKPSNKRSNAGSNKIVQVIRDFKNESNGCGPEKKIWIVVWGAITTTAQALWQDPSLAECVAVYQIGNWNILQDRASNDWLEKVFQPKNSSMLLIQNNESFIGHYSGGYQSHPDYNRKTHVTRVIRGRGTFNGFKKKLGDVYPLARVGGANYDSFKGGDDPSWLYLLAGSLGKSDIWDPSDENSWGGYFTEVRRNFWRDVPNLTQGHTKQRISKHRKAIFDEVYLPMWESR